MQSVNESIDYQSKSQAVRTSGIIAPLDLRAAIEETPPPLDYVLPGFLAGTVGALCAPGSAGKSWLSLGISVAVGTGHDMLGGPLRPPEGHTGRVLYLPSEDPSEVLAHRFHALGEHLNGAVREALYERVTVLPMIGRGACLYGADTSAAWVDWLRRQAEGCRLVILDTLRRYHAGDENSSSDMACLMRILEAISADTGASILYLHHVSKGAALGGLGDAQQAARGSSVLVDDARWQSALAGMSKEDAEVLGIEEDERHQYVRFAQPKVNYGPRPADAWLRRGDGGVLVPADFDATERRARARRKGEALKAGTADWTASRGVNND